jgi:hypothetical protein
LFEQLKHVGECVPSQQRSPAFCVSVIEIVMMRIGELHAPPVAPRVTVSVPADVAV